MTPHQLLGVIAGLVTVIVNGHVVSSGQPARLAGGHVVVPVAVIARIADRVDVIPGGVTVRRGDRTCAANVPVLLAPLARCLGAHVGFDAAAKTVIVTFGPPAGLATHAPFDPNVPQVAPTTIFTPEPARPTPRAIASGLPRPRRTAIPVGPPRRL